MWMRPGGLPKEPDPTVLVPFPKRKWLKGAMGWCHAPEKNVADPNRISDVPSKWAQKKEGVG